MASNKALTGSKKMKNLTSVESEKFGSDMVCIREATASAPSKTLAEVLEGLSESSRNTLCGFTDKVGPDALDSFLAR